jgi:hypothetical protein
LVSGRDVGLSTKKKKISQRLIWWIKYIHAASFSHPLEVFDGFGYERKKKKKTASKIMINGCLPRLFGYAHNYKIWIETEKKKIEKLH